MKEKIVSLAELSIGGKGSYGIGASAVPYSEELYTYLRITDIKDDGTINFQDLKSVYDEKASEYLLKPNDIVFARTGASTGRNYFYDGTDGEFVYAGFLIKFSIDDTKVNPKYIKYFCQSKQYKDWIDSFNTGSTRGNINAHTLGKMPVPLLDRQQQDNLVSVLSSIDEKIKKNNDINNNLEQQLNAIFVNMFADKIDNLEDDTTTLADLVGIVDNRGKTPPLSVEVTDYPIIDVKALSGNSRIIDYNNCTKYVSEDTYNTWFRSGHPQPEDILISTVGSLAEMKIFLGDIGCIAQNVVGFRSKEISPYYLYQYLNYIKHDLVAYNIGSVQPSIKITHIIKHAIYVPDEQQIKAFDTLARSISNQIFANCNENKNLTQLRDTLLPKLMSSELDVSNIDL